MCAVLEQANSVLEHAHAVLEHAHFATFDFFVKTKLVSTVWVSTSLSTFGYSQGRA